MTGQLLVDKLNREEWTARAAAFLDNNLYQCWDYGEAHTTGNRRITRVAWVDGSDVLAMAQLRVKVLPVAGIGVAEINWGPLWESASRPIGVAERAEFLRALRREVCETRGLHLRVEARQLDLNGEAALSAEKSFELAGFTPNKSLRAYRTTVLDLTYGADRLRAGLNAKWRTCLNQAEKAGLDAECGSTSEHFKRFEQLYNRMWEQKKFATGVRIDAIRAMQADAPEQSKLSIWIVMDKGVDVAAGVFSCLGNSVLYFLGASSPDTRKNSNPGYLVQWLNIRRSIELGFRYYDLGGLTDIEGSGVDLFKNRMGGTRLVFPGWFEAGASAWSLKTYALFEKGFRMARTLAQRK